MSESYHCPYAVTGWRFGIPESQAAWRRLGNNAKWQTLNLVGGRLLAGTHRSLEARCNLTRPMQRLGAPPLGTSDFPSEGLKQLPGSHRVARPFRRRVYLCCWLHSTKRLTKLRARMGMQTGVGLPSSQPQLPNAMKHLQSRTCSVSIMKPETPLRGLIYLAIFITFSK